MPRPKGLGFFVLMFDSSREWKQFELPGDVFNAGNGDIRNFNGRAVRVGVNGNGTRRLEDMGTFDQYQGRQDQQRLTEQTRAREGEFLGRVQGIPEAMRGLETELGLPQARETFQAAGEGVRTVAGQIRDVAPTQQTIAKQVGISAPRLQQRIGAETAKLQPSAETATRGLESAQAGLSGLLGAYQTRAENVLAPYQIEAGILGESVKNEFDLFKTNLQNSLTRELDALQRSNFNDQAALNRAHELAAAEKAANSGQMINLGDRLALINPSTGEVMKDYSIGLGPTRESSNTVPTPTITTMRQNTGTQSTPSILNPLIRGYYGW